MCIISSCCKFPDDEPEDKKSRKNQVNNSQDDNSAPVQTEVLPQTEMNVISSSKKYQSSEADIQDGSEFGDDTAIGGS